MARLPRFVIPDQPQHVIVRGNNRSGTQIAALSSATVNPALAPQGGQAITPITQVALPAGVVRSGGINTQVPNNSLSTATPDPAAHYLIETDPVFADYRAWLSSDYLLDALALDPALTQKRLGDGFYEQKLIREQVAQLTGRRFLDGHASDEAQYAALMDNGATFARAWHLVPGIELTAAQMAHLTSDIVWLVEKTITLPDGSTTQALVPQLYARVQEGDLQSGGALMAGDNVNLDVTGDLRNGGTLGGRQAVSLTAANLHNLGGRILGDTVTVAANTDLNNLGGVIAANNNLFARAGRDLTLTAAQVQSSGRAALGANHNLHLNTVQEAQNTTIVWDGANHRSDAGRAEAGTQIQTQGDLTLQAGNDLTAKAANVTSSQGSLAATAGNDLTLTAAQASIQLDEAHRHKGGGFLSKKTRTTRDTLEQTTAQGTTLSGNRVTVLAGHDLTLTGSNVVSDRGTELAAQRDLTLEAATATRAETRYAATNKKTGLAGRQRTIEATNQEITLHASTIAGGAGVSLTALGVVDIAASQLSSTGGDIRIEGGAVSIRSGLNQHNAEYRETRKKTGVNFKDIAGTFTPGEGMGFKSALAQDNADTRLVAATLDAQHITIRSTLSDIALTAIEANARGQTGAETGQQPGTLTLDAAHDLALASLATVTYRSTDHKKKDLAWQSVKGSGAQDETTRYTRLNAAEIGLAAGHRITADMSVKDSVGILARTPGMAWLRQLDAPALAGKIDWQSIEETHKKWDYKQQGLTPAAAVVVAVAVTYFTAGAGSAALGTTATTAAGSTTTLAGTTLATTTAATATTAAATSYTVAGAALNAAVTTLASQASVALLNNQGDLGKTLDDMGKSENVKALATAMVTAGALQSLSQNLDIGGTKLSDINAQSGFGQQLQKNLINNTASAVLDHAINGGDLQQMLEQSLKSAFIDTGAAQSANLIGDLYVEKDLNAFTHKLAHAIAGCAAGAARAGDCSSGALGAVVGEISAELYGGDRTNDSIDQPGFKTDTVNFARMMAGIAVAITGGDAEAINLAAAAGGNAAENNFLGHESKSERDRLRAELKKNGTLSPEDADKLVILEKADQVSDELLNKWKNNPDLLTANEKLALAGYLNVYAKQDGVQKFNQIMGPQAKLTGAFSNYDFPYAGSQEAKDAYLTAHPLGWKDYVFGREQTVGESTFYKADTLLSVYGYHQQWADVGTPALFAVPGAIGALASLTMVAGGSYQAGQGIGALLDGQYGTGATNLGLGTLAVFGGIVGVSAATGGFKTVGGGAKGGGSYR